jgi:4-carboxymuconolactone decarboxylase
MKRKDFATAGSKLAETLGLGLPNGAPGLDVFAAEAGFGSLWAREALLPNDRIIVVLTTLTCLQRLKQLSSHINVALDLGISPRGIQEIMVQSGLYGGLPIAVEGLEIASEVFTARGIEQPELEPAEVKAMEDSRDDLAAKGCQIMADLHNERSGDGYAAPDDPATSALYEIAIRYGYGVIWSRPGLEWRQRMLVGIAAFTALRLEATLKKFAVSALGQGLTREQVIEAIMQTAPYGGFPPALIALSQVKPVLFPET